MDEIRVMFGADLKDGFKEANAWVSGGIQWLDEIQQFYHERSTVECEYSQKLAAMARKYLKGKARKSSSLSVGENPSVESDSPVNTSAATWTSQLETLEWRAAEHEQFADQLMASVVEPLKDVTARYKELGEQHAEHAVKLESERDRFYADLKETKAKYDSVCQDVKRKHKKLENTFERGKTKAHAAYQQQLSDMRNRKNRYLIAINVANKQRDRYNYECLPRLLDSLQVLAESRVNSLNKVWSTATSLESQVLTRSLQSIHHLEEEIQRNNPLSDSAIFVRHNVMQWQDPPDFAFEPCAVWPEDDTMASDQQSKTILMNLLSKNKGVVGLLTKESDDKRRELETAKYARQQVRVGKDKRDELEVIHAMFHYLEAFHEAERRRVTADVEISTIISGMGDINVGTRNHATEKKELSDPTSCDLCADVIRDLSTEGTSCKGCEYSCHVNCELQLTADCSDELDKEAHKAIETERQSTTQAMAASPGSTSHGRGTDMTWSRNIMSSARASLSRLQRSDTLYSMKTFSSGYAKSANRSTYDATSRLPDGDSRVPSTTHSSPVTTSMACTDAGSGEQKGDVLCASKDTGYGKVSVSDTQLFEVAKTDESSTCVEKKFQGSETANFVPATYIEMIPGSPAARPASSASSVVVTSHTSIMGSSTPSTSRRQSTVMAPERNSAKKAIAHHVEALYTYNPVDEGETSMLKGETMVLITPDQGDGWCEVESRGGRGVMPAGWVKAI